MGKMAKGIHFTGTIGNVCYYEVGDRTYVRIKSSLTRKRVLKDKKFAPTMKHAKDLGRAAQIASAIYKLFPADIRGRWIFRAITGDAASLLYSGKTEQEVKDILWKKYVDDTKCANEDAVRAGCLNVFRASKETNRQLRTIFLQRWEKQGKSTTVFKRVWRYDSGFKPENIPRSGYSLELRRVA